MSLRTLCTLCLVVVLAWVGLSTVPAHAQAPTPPVPVAGDISDIDGEYGPHLPPDISTHGHKIDRLIHFLHYFMAVLFFGWGIFFVYCLVRFRQRAGRRAGRDEIKAKPAKYAEITVAIVEAVLLLGLSAPLWAEVKTLPPDSADAMMIRVVAEQFQWGFHYPGPDGEFGRTRPEFVDPAANVLGLVPSDPKGADDLFTQELHFPKNKKIICELSSKDVIHSFFLPVMRIKQDVVPGMTIPVWFEATKSGRYEVACAQLCGNNHYSMRAVMEVHETEESFAAWLVSQVPEDFDEDDLD